MKKLLLSICFLFALALTCNAQNKQNALVIRLLNGESATYLLEEQPRISFDATDLVIAWGEYEARYSVKELERYFFKHIENTGVKNPNEELLSLHQSENSLTITGMNQTHTVSIYTPAGITMGTHKPNSEGEATIQMADFAPGIYIVKYGNKTTKIKKL